MSGVVLGLAIWASGAPTPPRIEADLLRRAYRELADSLRRAYRELADSLRRAHRGLYDRGEVLPAVGKAEREVALRRSRAEPRELSAARRGNRFDLPRRPSLG